MAREKAEHREGIRERVERIAAQLAVIKGFEHIADALPRGGDPQVYFRNARPAIDALFTTNRRALGEKTAETLQATLRQMSTNLTKKRQKILEIHADPKKVIEKILDALSIAKETERATLSHRDVVAVDSTSDPYSIIVTLEKSAFERIFPNIDRTSTGELPRGLHIRGTPISLIRADIPNHKIVIEHERLHNRLEGIANDAPPMMRLVGDSVAYGAIGENPDIFNSRMYINDMHEEIAGGIEYAIALNFGRTPGKKISSKEATSLAVERYENALATAGVQMRALRAEIVRMVDAANSRALCSRFRTLYTNVGEEFVKTIGNIERSFRAIEKKPKDMQAALVEDLCRLAYLREPKDYSEIASYMEAQ